MNRLIVAAVLGLVFAGTASAQKRALTDSQKRALTVAIEDEVYDRGYEKKFYMVGREISPGVTRLPVYVKPDTRKATVVYKLMPYGEVIRGFHFTKDGLAVLEGDPDGGFPPTDADTLTLYMDDDDVCRWKRSWNKYQFEILDSPSVERIKEAGMRQKQRLGYSYQDAPPKERRAFPPR